MIDEAYFIQLLLKALGESGASVRLVPVPPPGETDALADIAAALRADTSDFDCIDEIIAIVESLGHPTVPRHDFG